MKLHIAEKWLREETWQRVVDNELDLAELKELVAVCDQHPELWKRCAVAFLEEQALCTELRKLGSQWPATAAVAAPHIPATDSLQAQQSGLTRTPSSPARAAAPLINRDRSTSAVTGRIHTAGAMQSSVLNCLALAASVMLAFIVGWQASRRIGEPYQRSTSETVSSLGSGTANRQAASSTTANTSTNRTRPGKSESFLTDDNAGGPKQLAASLNPVSTADAIHQALQRPDQFMPLDHRVPKELVDLQQRSLVRIESIEGIMTVQLQDGKTAVVPVQQFDVRSIRNAY